jgi:hypothetical protein
MTLLLQQEDAYEKVLEASCIYIHTVRSRNLLKLSSGLSNIYKRL